MEHRRSVPDADVVCRLGIRVTRAARTWLDLTTLYPRLDRDDLVVAGDHFVRVGSISPPETRARLAMVDAGLPEPGLQVPADPADPYSPKADLGLVRWKIALQYEGYYHRDARQHAADARRDAWFQTRGWLVIRITSEDLQDGFPRVVRLVRERISSHGH